MRPRPRCVPRPATPAAFPAFALVVVFALAAPPAARAQTGISTNLDLSVRAAGMGRCSNAVFWGGDLDAWSNPALLGYQSGLRYENARTRLVPDIANDVFLTSNRLAVGGDGVGFLFAGKPVDGLGSVHLDYGVSQATGPSGEPLGTFDSYEHIRSWSMGVSLGRVAASLAHARGGRTPWWARHADVAAGMTQKDVEIFLAPALPGAGLGSEVRGTASADDEGILVRLSPYDSFDGPGFLPGLDRVLRLSVDASYGGSTLNRHAPLVAFSGFGSIAPLMQERHRGWAGHFALEPRALERPLDDRHLRWLVQSLSPLVSVGGAWDRNTLDFEGYDPVSMSTYPVHSRIVKRGFEVTVLNVFSWRRGHISDPDGSIHGPTSGWGVGWSFDGIAGVRYDRATVPEATDPTTGERLSDVHRRAWSFFIDPLRWRAHRERGIVAAR